MFPMAANILPMHKKIISINIEPPFYFSQVKMVQTGLSEEKSCLVMIDVFLKNAHSDTIRYYHVSANFFRVKLYIW